MLFDMDGTLLNSEKRIPAETVRMMEKAERAGLASATQCWRAAVSSTI